MLEGGVSGSGPCATTPTTGDLAAGTLAPRGVPDPSPELANQRYCGAFRSGRVRRQRRRGYRRDDRPAWTGQNTQTEVPPHGEITGTAAVPLAQGPIRSGLGRGMPAAEEPARAKRALDLQRVTGTLSRSIRRWANPHTAAAHRRVARQNHPDLRRWLVRRSGPRG